MERTARTPAGGRRILVVEDDAAIRDSLVECLEAEGFEVQPAGNGAEGLSRLRSRRPNLVVLDLVMPVMNGAEFLDAVARDAALRDVPIVLMTAAMPSSAEGLPRATGYLAKPFELGELLDAVERHCTPDS